MSAEHSTRSVFVQDLCCSASSQLVAGLTCDLGWLCSCEGGWPCELPSQVTTRAIQLPAGGLDTRLSQGHL